MNKLTTDFRADKKNPVWVRVLNVDEEKAENKRRIALEVFKNGRIRCVDGDHKEKYLNNEEYGSIIWDNHELLPEKKLMPYTPEELHDLGAREVKCGMQYHIITDFYSDNAIKIFNEYISIDQCIENGWLWTSDTESPFTWHPFVREV